MKQWWAESRPHFEQANRKKLIKSALFGVGLTLMFAVLGIAGLLNNIQAASALLWAAAWTPLVVLVTLLSPVVSLVLEFMIIFPVSVWIGLNSLFSKAPKGSAQ